VIGLFRFLLGYSVQCSIYLAPREQWVLRIMTLVSLLVSITIHEFAHAKPRDYLGMTRRVVRGVSRSTRSPTSIPSARSGSFLLTFVGAGFGWGKAGHHEPDQLHKASMRVGRCWVTAAGHSRIW
jgi:hypothetical protein